MITNTIEGVELIAADDMVLHHQKRTGKPFEQKSIAAWLSACKDGVSVLDVGAYTGLYSIAAAKAGADVVAFEPNSPVFDRLEENAKANNVCFTAYNCAAGSSFGSVSMDKNRSVRLTSGGRVTKGGDIPQVTIDSLLLPNVSAIKIDVEGYEVEVLKGSIGTISRCKPLIITEALTEAAAAEQEAILCPIGYKPTKADEHNLIWLR